MPRSKIDSWLMQQAGKPADPDEPANLPAFGYRSPVVSYRAVDGSIQAAYTSFWAAMQALTPHDLAADLAIAPDAAEHNVTQDMVGISIYPDPADWDRKLTRMLPVTNGSRATDRSRHVTMFRNNVDRSVIYIPWVKK